MEIEYKILDTLAPNFENAFKPYETEFYNVLSKSYTIYYGIEYDKERIRNGKAILYFALVDNIVVAVSYVKRNNRRGTTAVYPEEYRKLGLAKKLIELSLKDFPSQYSILSTRSEHSYKMLSLLQKEGFKKASFIKEIKNIVGAEFALLSNFRHINDYLVFDRQSERRKTKREFLTLLHTFKWK